MAKNRKLKLAWELRALNHDAASGVTPLVLGENPSPTWTRSKTSTVSGSAEHAAIFDVKSRREPPGETQGSTTPLTRSIADPQEVASHRPTPLTRSSPGDETPSVEGVPSATMCSGDDRLNPVITPQDRERVKGTLPVLPGAHTDTWSNLVGHEMSRRVWRDLDEPDDRANDPIYPGLTTPKSELGTQKLLLLYDDDIPRADEIDAKEHLSELISHMGQAVSQMKAARSVTSLTGGGPGTRQHIAIPDITHQCETLDAATRTAASLTRGMPGAESETRSVTSLVGSNPGARQHVANFDLARQSKLHNVAARETTSLTRGKPGVKGRVTSLSGDASERQSLTSPVSPGKSLRGRSSYVDMTCRHTSTSTAHGGATSLNRGSPYAKMAQCHATLIGGVALVQLSTHI